MKDGCSSEKQRKAKGFQYFEKLLTCDWWKSWAQAYTRKKQNTLCFIWFSFKFFWILLTSKGQYLQRNANWPTSISLEGLSCSKSYMILQRRSTDVLHSVLIIGVRTWLTQPAAATWRFLNVDRRRLREVRWKFDWGHREFATSRRRWVLWYYIQRL